MAPLQQSPDPGDRIADAARLLAADEVRRPIVVALRQRGLSVAEVVAACRLAARLRQEGGPR